MNKIELIGRLTADPELRYNSSNVAYTRFNIAVNRNFLNADGEREADFISCVAWRKTAEIINEHFRKGSQIGIDGRLQTGSYEKEDGTRMYTADVIIENITFIDKKRDSRPEPELAEPVRENEQTPEEDDPFKDFGDSVEIDDNDLPW